MATFFSIRTSSALGTAEIACRSDVGGCGSDGEVMTGTDLDGALKVVLSSVPGGSNPALLNADANAAFSSLSMLLCSRARKTSRATLPRRSNSDITALVAQADFFASSFVMGNWNTKRGTGG